MTTLQTACLPETTRAVVPPPAGDLAHHLTGSRMAHAYERCGFVQNTVALGMRVNIDLLSAPTRQRAPIAFARQVAMYLAHISCGLTLTDVGRCFGRDRTTVGHACQVVEDRRDNPRIDLMLDYLEAAVLDWYARFGEPSGHAN